LIPGIGSMGGAELLIVLVILLILFFGANRLPALGRSFGIGMWELRKDDAKQRPRNNEEGKEIAPKAGKGEGSV
jgi:TatA/E family protein of Tat protein translocase